VILRCRVAVCSIPDGLALTLLMDWLALSTSTVTTNSSLLSAGMKEQRCASVRVPTLWHRLE
jgi:hypothetical protein